MSLKDRPKLFAVMPGALMYRVEPSHGLAPTELDVTRQVRCITASASFSGIPEAQRDVLVESIAQTIERANYHFQRFRVQRQSLDEIRAWAPGDVFFDIAVTTMHYELQALAGAARLLVDELVFLIATRHGYRNWEAVQLLREPIPAGSPMDQAETHRLRAHVAWFDLLNAYRNVFFHRGWTHGSGHFESDGRQAADSPRMNALLVPDRASLGGRSRPYDWTYNDGTTVDYVANGIHQGMIDMVDDLCANEWETAVPPPGTIADNERPNLMVALPVPIMLTIGDCALVPIFSSRERAMSFVSQVPELSAKVESGGCELIEVRSNPDILPPTEVVGLSFARLDAGGSAKLLRVCLDPLPQNPEWSLASATAVHEVPVEDVLRDKFRIVGIPVAASMTAYVWRVPFLIQ